MNLRRSHLIITVLLAVRFFFCPVAAAPGAQRGADIYARKMEIVKTPAGPATVFSDSVVITQEGNFLFSRRAVIQEQVGKGWLSESVFIRTPEAQVWADSVVYEFPQRRATLLGVDREVLVRQKGSAVEIMAPRIEYYLAEELLAAPQGLKITALPEGGNAADTEPGRRYSVSGARGSYHLGSRVGVVDSEPKLTIEPDGEPVEVTAERMTYREQDGVARAEGNVRVHSGASGLLCDTALFFPNRDSGIAWGGPVVFDSSGRAEGDTVVFLLSRGSLHEVALVGKTRGRYRTEGGDTVLIQGREISLLISEGKIDRIAVAELNSGQLIRPRVAGPEAPSPGAGERK